MEKKRVQRNNRVLKFEQNSEYYNRRALRLLEKNDMWGALASLRLAEEKDPSNADYRMSIAEILSQMGLYEQSNELLFHNIVSGAGDSAECFFALSDNFFALRQAKLCQDCIAYYMQLEPNGEYAADCEDMLYILEQDMAEASIYSTSQMAADEGKRALDDGRFDEAVHKLTNALAVDEGDYFARNNLALAYFCLNETEKAIGETEKVLEKRENDIHALCNMALFQNGGGEREKAEEYLSLAAKQPSPGDDELYKLCVTHADLGYDKEAFSYCREILKYSPYDLSVLYLSALAQYNLGMYGSGNRTTSRLLLLEPENASYLHLSRLMSAAGGSNVLSLDEGRPEKLDYSLSMPTLEAIKLFDRLHKFMALPPEDAKRRFDSDAGLRATIRWCFSLDDSDVKYDLAMSLAKSESEKAVRLILLLLLSPAQTDDFKKTLVMALYAQNVSKPPYFAVIGENLAEIRLKKMPAQNAKVPVGYERVLRTALEDREIRQNDAVSGLAMHLWVNYMVGLEGNIPPIRSVHGRTAALVYAALKLGGKKADAAQIAKQYKTREKTVLDSFEIFENIYERMAEEREEP